MMLLKAEKALQYDWEIISVKDTVFCKPRMQTSGYGSSLRGNSLLPHTHHHRLAMTQLICLCQVTLPDSNSLAKRKQPIFCLPTGISQ